MNGSRRDFIKRAIALGAAGCAGPVRALSALAPGGRQLEPWRMIEPGAGGAFFAIGAGPTGIAVVAADLSGPYISYDRGRTWSDRGAREGITDSTHTCAVGFDPKDEALIYVGTNGGLYRSNDGGKSFQEVSGRSLYWTAITFSASDPRIGYAAGHSAHNSVDATVFKTSDRGMTWHPAGALPAGEAIRLQKLVIDPKDPKRVFALSQPDKFSRPFSPSTALYCSLDGAASWRTVVSLGLNVLDFDLDPSDPNVAYATRSAKGRGDDPEAGFYRSGDAAQTWSRIGRQIGVIKAKSGGGASEKTVIRLFDFIGWEANPRVSERKYPRVWESSDGGRAWRLKAGPDKFSFGAIDPQFYGSSSAFCKTIAASPANPDDYYWVDSQWVYRSDDGGASFRSAGSDMIVKPDGQKWYRTTGVSNVVSLTLKVSQADPRIVVGGCADIGLWRSLDGGNYWQCANEPGYLSDWIYYGGQAQAIALDPARPNVMWAGLGAGYVDQVMIKSEAYGKIGSWRRSHEGLPLEKRRASYQAGAALRGLCVDPSSPRDARILYVVADDRVFRSADDGAHWSVVCDLSGGHPFDYHANARGKNNYDRQGATAVDPRDGRYVYAGATDGCYFSDQGGAPGTWRPAGDGSLKRVQKIVVSQVHPARVYAACYGTGLYRSDDHGRHWELILRDRFLRGVAVHPLDDRILFAASSNAFSSGGQPDCRGALLSTDDGATWQSVNLGLSWPFVRDVEFNPGDPSQVYIVTPGTSYHVARFAF